MESTWAHPSSAIYLSAKNSWRTKKNGRQPFRVPTIPGTVNFAYQTFWTPSISKAEQFEHILNDKQSECRTFWLPNISIFIHELDCRATVRVQIRNKRPCKFITIHLFRSELKLYYRIAKKFPYITSITVVSWSWEIPSALEDANPHLGKQNLRTVKKITALIWNCQMPL